MQKEILDLTKKLVAIASVSGDEKRADEVLSLVKKYLGSGFVYREFKSAGFPSLLIKPKAVNPRFMLVGHIDVVPASPEMFKLSQKGDKLFGRGAGDMKGAVAASLVFLKKTKAPFWLLLTSDEELGSENGTKYFLQRVQIKPQFVIIPDGDGGLNKMITRHKGVLVLKITFHGKAAHSAYLWEGGNALIKMGRAIVDLDKKLFSQYRKDAWHITYAPTKAESGDALNKIPDCASLYLNIRRTEKESVSSIVREIKKIVSPAKVEILDEGGLFFTDPKNKYFQHLQKSTEEVTGRKCEITFEHGATDARLFSEKKIPAVMAAPKGGKLHAPGEWVSLKSLEKLYQTLVDFTA